jgi:hypothetical protein
MAQTGIACAGKFHIDRLGGAGGSSATRRMAGTAAWARHSCCEIPFSPISRAYMVFFHVCLKSRRTRANVLLASDNAK